MSLLDDPALTRALLAGLPEALIVTDTGGVIRYWNEAAERLFGHSGAEAVGASLDLLVPERFKAAHDAGFARAVASGHLRVGGACCVPAPSTRTAASSTWTSASPC